MGHLNGDLKIAAVRDVSVLVLQRPGERKGFVCSHS